MLDMIRLADENGFMSLQRLPVSAVTLSGSRQATQRPESAKVDSGLFRCTAANGAHPESGRRKQSRLEANHASVLRSGHALVG